MEHASKILIVDDDPKMTDSLRALLKGRGYEIETTNSSNAALKILKTSDFDLALLDIMMPEMNGFQLMDSLDREYMNMLFVIMTGDASMESAIEAVRKGASDYIRKPFEPDELLIRIEKVLRQKKWSDERKKAQEEKRDLESQLRQSHKMEAIGTLAGGIAHDFNNMLGIIIGNAELAIEALTEGSQVRQYIKRILAASTRAEEMINRLLRFSRMTELEKRAIKLEEIVGETLNLLRSSLPTNIEIRKEIQDEPFIIHCDPIQINQIILNLCTNAAHAMQQSGGIIRVRLEKDIMYENSKIESSILKREHYCKLIVSDTGHGIDRNIIDRIFDPYFTTKESGKGTGMGLSVVHGIVKSHGGDIKVSSEPAKGTEFCVYLPLADIKTPEQAVDATGELVYGKEHVLIVDDEDMIVDIMKEMLEKLGYHVTAFNNSTDALREFQTHSKNYDLVITDMTMPGMTGDRLAEEMKKLKTDIPIIICTGFNEAINRAKAEMKGIQGFIMKPVNMTKLSKTIRKVLETEIVDRRRCKRFITKGDSYVLTNSDAPKKFNILDISEAGLAFSYLTAGKQAMGAEKLAIATADDNFMMEDIKYRTISDIEIDMESSTFDSPIRRRGIQFDSLTPLQEEQLKFFIRNYTHGLTDQRGQDTFQ